MDGGQVDGQNVTVEMTLNKGQRRSSPITRRSPIRKSPPRRRSDFFLYENLFNLAVLLAEEGHHLVKLLAPTMSHLEVELVLQELLVPVPPVAVVAAHDLSTIVL